MIFDSPDRYVKLGRQFLSRAEMEFGIEIGGRYQKPAGTFEYDPLGQSGRPVWLSIRRERHLYQAFLSTDGLHWQAFGNTLVMPAEMGKPRFAVFAHQGRARSAPATARFSELSLGLEFHSRTEGPADLTQFAGWRLDSDCPGGAEPQFSSVALIFPQGRSARSCQSLFSGPVPAGDWEYSTLLDFVSRDGSAAGLHLSGAGRPLRLVRWDFNGGSITAEHLGHNQASLPDYRGSPPLVLRMSCRQGIVTCAFSRDGETFTKLPLTVALSSFGVAPRIGLAVSRSSWTGAEDLPPAQFHYIRRIVDRLDPWRK
jgi:hypothetical protein